MNAAREWTQDEIDADMDRDYEPDLCHHGVGFDENCEWCDYEIQAEDAEARRLARLKKQPQLMLSLPDQPGCSDGN
jgi:hypothetical protein